MVFRFRYNEKKALEEIIVNKGIRLKIIYSSDLPIAMILYEGISSPKPRDVYCFSYAFFEDSLQDLASSDLKTEKQKLPSLLKITEGRWNKLPWAKILRKPISGDHKSPRLFRGRKNLEENGSKRLLSVKGKTLVNYRIRKQLRKELVAWAGNRQILRHIQIINIEKPVHPELWKTEAPCFVNCDLKFSHGIRIPFKFWAVVSGKTSEIDISMPHWGQKATLPNLHPSNEKFWQLIHPDSIVSVASRNFSPRNGWNFVPEINYDGNVNWFHHAWPKDAEGKSILDEKGFPVKETMKVDGRTGAVLFVQGFD
jgi:hypothetical protein